MWNFLKSKKGQLEWVHKEVEHRKVSAIKSGIPQMVNSLYQYDIRYYPSWLNGAAAKYIPNAVKDARLENFGERESLSFTLYNHEYLFVYTRPKFELGDGMYTLDLFSGEKKVLSLRGYIHRFSDLDGFVPGDWIRDFKRFKQELDKEERKKIESPEKITKEIEQLRKDFGIK